MKRLVFIFLLLIALPCIKAMANPLDSLKIDSLKNQLTNEKDYLKIADLYYEIVDLYYYNNQDSAILYSKLYLEASIKTKDIELIAYGYYLLTDLYYYSNLDSALFYSGMYLRSSQEMEDTLWIAEAYNYIAYLNDKMGRLNLALENFQKASDYFQYTQDTYNIGASYNNIGYIISYSLDQPGSLGHLIKALEFAEAIGDSSLISDASCNIAYYYESIKDDTKARLYYQRSLDMSMGQAQTDSLNIALSFANLAHADIRLKNFINAEKYLKASKNYISESQDIYYLASLYSTYADCYLEWEKTDSVQVYIEKFEVILEKNQFGILLAYLSQQKGFLSLLNGDYRGCLKELDKCIDLYNELEYTEGLSKIYEKEAEAYSSLNMNKEAYHSLLQANSYADSLKYGIIASMLSEQEQERFYTSAMRTMELEMELERQKMEASNYRIKSNLRIAGMAIILLLVSFSIIAYFMYKLRKNNAELKIKNDFIESQRLQLENTIQKLKISEEELKELNAAKDKFFSIIAHDLKNPLSSIVGLSDLLLTEKDLLHSDRIIPIMESMNETANYGFNLLENLLEWALSQTGKITTRPQNLEIDKLIKELTQHFNTIARNKNITFELKSEKPPLIFADQNMVKTILRNLIHNAIKFSHPNSVVKIMTFPRDNFLITCVEDQGVGISETDLSTLFNIRNQVRKYGTSQEQGTGLGLLLCKEFVEKNNGEIWVEGEEGKGCKFSFTLPLANVGSPTDAH